MTEAHALRRHPSSLIGGLASAVGLIELTRQLPGAGTSGGSSLEGRELYMDAENHQQYLTALQRNSDCAFDHEGWAVERREVAQVRDLFALARDAGERARLGCEGEPFLRAFTCPACGKRQPSFALRRQALRELPVCEACGEPLVVTGFEMTDWLERCVLDERVLDLHPSELGLRERDVVTLRDACADRDRHVELAFAAPVRAGWPPDALTPHGDPPPLASRSHGRSNELPEGDCASGQGGAGRRSDPGATVVLVGCGNIGSHAAGHLARLAGRDLAVSRVLLVDPDRYEAHNVAGQEIVLEDVERPKVAVQAERMRAANPRLEVETLQCRIEEVPRGSLRGSIVLGAVDSRAARQSINQAAWRMGVPWIDMAVSADALLCRVSTYRPGPDAVCLECGWDQSDYDALEQELPCQRARGR